MKRILLPLALALAFSAQAQVEKPKAKLMSREALRSCIDLQEANGKEADAIKVEQYAYKASAEKLRAEKAEVEAGEAELSKQAVELKAERDAILAAHETLVAETSKLEKAEQQARKDAYKARTVAFATRVDAVKAFDAEQAIKRKAFGDKIDALDLQFKAIEERTEKHFDANDKWKAQCQNKPYDENDEKAIRKEKAAAGK